MHCEFEVSLLCIVSPRPARETLSPREREGLENESFVLFVSEFRSWKYICIVGTLKHSILCSHCLILFFIVEGFFKHCYL